LPVYFLVNAEDHASGKAPPRSLPPASLALIAPSLPSIFLNKRQPDWQGK
jgi:hypothetical protein